MNYNCLITIKIIFMIIIIIHKIKYEATLVLCIRKYNEGI